MEMLTGPQTTADQRGDLSETAGLLGLTLVKTIADLWDAKRLWLLPGWDVCSTALADVDAAMAWAVPVSELAM